MLYTLVEPHRGHEVAYNRWYERDHFYAGCQIGAYNFAGARFVSTAPLKAPALPRRGTARWWPTRRSAATSASTTCSTATTTSGTGGRSTRSTRCTPAGRMFERARPHPHRALPVRVGAPPRRRRRAGRAHPRPPVRRDGLGASSSRPTASTGAERRRPGCASTYLPRCCPDRRWPPCSASARCRSWPTRRATSRVTRRWTSGCCCSASSTRIPTARFGAVSSARWAPPWPRRPASAAVQWASPFIGTVPGTDTYTDQLWVGPVAPATTIRPPGPARPPATGAGDTRSADDMDDEPGHGWSSGRTPADGSSPPPCGG